MAPREVASVELPTAFGAFRARAFSCDSGFVYLALTMGEPFEGGPVLTRIHSECLTGDALGSLRCDCGVQLRSTMRAIAAEGSGVLVYATGHEGRGIGLVNKLRAYVEQDNGADTMDANLHLGLPVDAREYTDAAAVLIALGVDCVRLITNNPRKAQALLAAGIEVEATREIATASSRHNVTYLRTKQTRLGHIQPLGRPLNQTSGSPPDVTSLLGDVAPVSFRPYVILKYAQSLDGRIATASGDSKWISGEQERTVSHALRAGCDAVMVGVGTVLHDDPQLTVRLVPGSSPLRVILDSKLRVPLGARVLDDDAPTLVITTAAADPAKRQELERLDVAVWQVAKGPAGVGMAAALAALRAKGVGSLLVEGGARVITSLLRENLVDRLIVGIAPTILGSGTEGVADLGIERIRDGIRLGKRSIHSLGDDVLLAWDVIVPASAAEISAGEVGAAVHN